MAQLSANKKRTYGEVSINELPVKAASIIYEGSAVGIDSSVGYARQLNAGDQFAGFCLQKVDNASGAGAAVSVKVQAKGFVVAALTTAATDQGKAVYMSDGDTFTLTQGANTHVGSVYRIIDSSNCIVAFEASNANSLFGIAELTQAAGSADDTVVDVGAAFSQATLNNNFADLSAKVNAILRVLRT